MKTIGVVMSVAIVVLGSSLAGLIVHAVHYLAPAL